MEESVRCDERVSARMKVSKIVVERGGAGLDMNMAPDVQCLYSHCIQNS